MKKLILLAVLVLVGCDDEPDRYSLKKTLAPAEVVALHNICKGQPNYDTSWVQRRDGEAKGVTCRYRDADYSRSNNTYTIDAEVLKIKIQEGLVK